MFELRIGADALRDEIEDNPGLSENDRERLLALDSETLASGLEEVFRSYEDTFYQMLDSMRSDAIDALLRRI